MILNIKPLIILITAVILFIKYPQISYSTTHSNYIKNESFYIIPKNWYQKKTKLFYKNQKINQSKDWHNISNKIITYPHLKKFSSYPACNISKINLKNDSINIFHIFYNYHNNQKYYRTFPFIQLGLQNILSEKIISLGGGNRYLHNNLHVIGYNTFYHFSVSQSLHPSYLMNIGGEYWYRNVLFTLNNFININNFLNIKPPIPSYDTTKHLKNGYQINIQTKIPIFSEFIGKITLEYLLYTSSIKKNYPKKHNNMHKNYRLILGLDYYPIPILGFNINKIYKKNEINNIICKILVNYQFNVPISQQINKINNQKFLLPVFNYLNSIIELSIPPAIINNNNNIQEDNFNFCDEDNDYHKNYSFQHFYNEIIGFPGEIKIIEINNDTLNESIKWDEQTIQKLQSLGGNITSLKQNTYIINMPHRIIKKENPLILLYTIINKKNNYRYISPKRQILILVRNFADKNLSHPSTTYINKQNKNTIINDDNSFYKNKKITTDNQQDTFVIDNNDYYYQNLQQYDDISSDNLISQEQNLCHMPSPSKNNDSQKKQQISLSHDESPPYKNNNDNNFYPSPPPSITLASLEESMQYISRSNDSIENILERASFSGANELSFFLPIPPPLPSSLSLTENINIDNIRKDQETKKILLSESSGATLTPERAQSALDYHCSDDVFLPVFSNTTQNYKKKIVSSIDDNNTKISSESNQNLLDLLSKQKKLKFSSIGTPEHIDKLENNITKNQKYKHLSDMEKIFSRLHFTQSSSSIDDYKTDNSNDSLFSSESLDFKNNE